jgi:hypothetical protein
MEEAYGQVLSSSTHERVDSQERGGSVKMAKITFQLSAFEAPASQEKRWSKLPNSIYYAKLPTTFVGGGLYGKSRIIVVHPRFFP